MANGQFCRDCEQLILRSGTGWFGRYIEVGDESIHYVEAGTQEPLVLVHGFLSWSMTWRRNLVQLSDHARVIAPDLRGFGLSERNPRRGHSLFDQTELLAHFLDALGLKKVVLCGHSMGGEIALRFTLRYPERVSGLILASASGYIRRRPTWLEKWMNAVPMLWSLWSRMALLNRRFAARALRSGYGRLRQPSEADVSAYLLPATVSGTPVTFAAMMRDMDFGQDAGRLREIRHPALLIWGQNDPWVPLSHGEQLAKDLVQSRLTVFEGCGHLPHEEAPDRFNQAVIEFLKRLRASEAPPV